MFHSEFQNSIIAVLNAIFHYSCFTRRDNILILSREDYNSVKKIILFIF